MTEDAGEEPGSQELAVVELTKPLPFEHHTRMQELEDRIHMTISQK